MLDGYHLRGQIWQAAKHFKYIPWMMNNLSTVIKRVGAIHLKKLG